MRVIVSMTTIPSRSKTIVSTLESLADQTATSLIDEVRVHFAPGCELPDTKIPYHKFILSTDYGPVTKLYAINDSHLEPDDLIITVDDDQIYKPTWLATILEAAAVWPDDAIGFAGWDVKGFLEGTGGYHFCSAPSFCDVLEGWAGAAYRKRFFDGIDMMAYPREFQYVDDVWISSVLNKRGIRRRLIAFPMATPRDRDAPGLHTRHDFVELNRNASIAGFGVSE